MRQTKERGRERERQRERERETERETERNKQNKQALPASCDLLQQSNNGSSLAAHATSCRLECNTGSMNAVWHARTISLDASGVRMHLMGPRL